MNSEASDSEIRSDSGLSPVRSSDRTPTDVRTYERTEIDSHLGDHPTVPERATRTDAEPADPGIRAVLSRLTAERFQPVPEHRIAVVHRRRERDIDIDPARLSAKYRGPR